MSRSRGCLVLAGCLALTLASGTAHAEPGDALPTTAVVRCRHDDPVFAVAFSPDGKVLATGSYDRRDPMRLPRQRPAASLHLWDVASGKELAAFGAHRGRTFSLAFAPDGKRLVSAGEDGALRFWDVAGRREVRLPAGQPRGQTCVVFAPDGKTLASVVNNRILLWDPVTGGQRAELVRTAFDICTIAFAPDGKTLASVGGTDLAVHLWDAAKGGEVRTFPGQAGNFIAVAFAPDGRTLAAGGNDPATRFWEPATGKGRLVIDEPCNRLAYAPDGRMLASEGPGASVRLWEAATGKERCRLGQHAQMVQCVAFAPDGRLLASGSEDGTVLVWDVARCGADGRAPAGPASPEEAEALWKALAGEDAAVAYRALRALSAAPARALPLLKERLRPVPGEPGTVAEATLRQFVCDLDSDEFGVRQQATAALAKLGKAAEPALRRALDGDPSTEVRRRVEELLKKLDPRVDEDVPAAEELRALRVEELLEDVGTPEARQLLETLAGGAAGARTTLAAKGALGRLNRQHAPTP